MNPTDIISGLPIGKVIICDIRDGKLQSLKHYWPLSSYFFDQPSHLHLHSDDHETTKQLVEQLLHYVNLFPNDICVISNGLH